MKLKNDYIFFLKKNLKLNTYWNSFPQPRGPKNISVGRQTFLQTPLRVGQDQGKAAASFSTTGGTTGTEGYWSVCFFLSLHISFNLYFLPIAECGCIELNNASLSTWLQFHGTDGQFPWYL